MVVRSKWQQAISFIVTLSLCLQLFAIPQGQPASAAPDNSARAIEPADTARPLSISRVQSSYQSGGTVTITVTVSNNLPPTHSPEIPPAATVTDTLNILASHTITSDANTLHSVLLTDTGIVALSGQFSSNPVSLNPGQSITVQLTGDAFDFAPPLRYPFAVAATSQNDSRIHDEDTSSLIIGGYEAVQVNWRPVSRTVTGTLSAGLILSMTNTGNLVTDYQLSLNSSGLSATLSLSRLTLPARQTAALYILFSAPDVGEYHVEGMATGSAASDSSDAWLMFNGGPTTIGVQSLEVKDAGAEGAFPFVAFLLLLVTAGARFSRLRLRRQARR